MTELHKYRCPYCHYILEREVKRRWIVSRCDKVGKVARCKFILPVASKVGK